jgi:glycosyltransferase involved in cell wall biosynthesis
MASSPAERPAPFDFVAAVGDVSDPATWSGIPHHLLLAAEARGFAVRPWRLNLGPLAWPRRLWNVRQILLGRGRGGFQYSEEFLQRAEGQIPVESWRGRVLTFHQHFPRTASVTAHGGSLVHYLDAPFAALVSGRGLPLRLPARICASALWQERENLAKAERIYCMARWCADALVALCGVPRTKIRVILPGASVPALPAGGSEPAAGWEDSARPLVLGFVGKDWRRKGLPFLLEVAGILARMGCQCRVRAAGFAPEHGPRHPLLESVGFLDKRRAPGEFVAFLLSCDLGCLFSTHEALGISTLEFLGVGRPVAGFAHEGMADTLPPDAGFRFAPEAPAVEVAEAFRNYARDEDRRRRFMDNAARYAPLVTWERCVDELAEDQATGMVSRPLQPWLGVDTLPTPSV